MLSGALARGADPGPMLQAAAVPGACLAPRGPRVPITSYVALYNTVVRALDDEGFALFSAPLRTGTFEFLCRSVIGAANLGEALERAARFLRLVLPDLRVSLERSGDSAWLEIAEVRRLRPRSADPCRVFAFEWLLRLMHGLACWLVGRGIALDQVRFPYPKPPHYADYALIYTEHSVFAGKSLLATFDAALLDLPVIRDAPDLAAFLEGAPGKISMLYRRDREMVRTVRDLLARDLAAAPSLEEAARRLHVSARTLHRRLRAEGSSFRAIKDSVRRELAIARLEKTRDSVARIASDLGYAEPSAFFRAFHEWAGVAPTAYRKRFRTG